MEPLPSNPASDTENLNIPQLTLADNSLSLYFILPSLLALTVLVGSIPGSCWKGSKCPLGVLGCYKEREVVELLADGVQ